MGTGNYALANGPSHMNNNLSPLHQHINKVLIENSPALTNHNLNGVSYSTTNNNLANFATTQLPHPSSNLMMMYPTNSGGSAPPSHQHLMASSGGPISLAAMVAPDYHRNNSFNYKNSHISQHQQFYQHSNQS